MLEFATEDITPPAPASLHQRIPQKAPPSRPKTTLTLVEKQLTRPPGSAPRSTLVQPHSPPCISPTPRPRALPDLHLHPYPSRRLPRLTFWTQSACSVLTTTRRRHCLVYRTHASDTGPALPRRHTPGPCFASHNLLLALTLLRRTAPTHFYIHISHHATSTSPKDPHPTNMHFETSPGSSPSKSIPISIKAMGSPSDSLYSIASIESCSSTSSHGASCAYPSWPTGSSLGYRSTPSSFVSDEDLFGDDFDDDCPYLLEPPAPPRQPAMAQAFPILPPLYANDKPKKQQQQQQRRRSSGRKVRRSSKPMTPISESPEAPRE